MFLSIIAIFISLSALSFSLFIYYKHDKQIKKQTAIINNFQIEKFQKDFETDKKAFIDVTIVKQEKGKRIVKVSNNGKAVACNVKVIFPQEIEISIRDFPSPTEINPGSFFDIYIQIYKESPDIANIEIGWDDDFEKNRKEKLRIQL